MKNPLFNRPKRRSRFSFKSKFIFFSVIAALSGLGWLLFFSRVFLITGMEISGADGSIKSAAEIAAWSQAGKRRWFFFRQNNLFVFNKKALADRLKSGYALDRLIIKKSLFHKIKIEFDERKYAYIWKEGDKFYYIDGGGGIIKEADPLSIQTDKTAIIENRAAPLAPDQAIKNEGLRIGYAGSLNEAVKGLIAAPFSVERYILDSDPRTVRLKIASSGPEILFNTESAPQSQLDRLLTLAKNKLKAEFMKKKYIDLRFGELIYYQ
jgi:hypothetical protein